MKRRKVAWPPQLPANIEIIPASVATRYERVATDNPALEAWYAVRQEWIANDGRVTSELRQLEKAAREAVDSRYAATD